MDTLKVTRFELMEITRAISEAETDNYKDYKCWFDSEKIEDLLAKYPNTEHFEVRPK